MINNQKGFLNMRNPCCRGICISILLSCFVVILFIFLYPNNAEHKGVMDITSAREIPGVQEIPTCTGKHKVCL